MIPAPPLPVDTSPLRMTRIMVRPLGSPLPLGFFAFAIGSTLIGALDVGWIPPSESRALAVAMLCFVGPLELLASVLAYLARDTAGGTSLGFFGASWVTLGAWFLISPADNRLATLAVFAFAEALALLLLAAASVSTKPMFAVVLLLATARMVLLGVRHLGVGRGLATAEAIVSALAAAMGFYAALALLFEDMTKRTVLPLLRRKKARTAIHGELADQLQDIERTPGVRQQL
jgi:succinate-acetate transporter protein